MDALDHQIVDLLQREGRATQLELSRTVGLSQPAVAERIRKLEERGTIRGYSARLDPRAFGLGLLAFVYVRAEERPGAPETASVLAELPEVQELHHIAGEDCFLLKVRVADTEALGQLLRERLGTIPTVRSTRTTIVLQTVKESGALPLPGGPLEG